MPIDLDQECSRLKQATVSALRQRYAEVFGESPAHTGNRTWLLRRILWSLQAFSLGFSRGNATCLPTKRFCFLNSRDWATRG
jgi:hypothetical protein